MTSYYRKDGEEFRLDYVNIFGRPGQLIVVTNVFFGEKPDLAKYPFAAYPQPSFFTIVKKIVETKFAGLSEEENARYCERYLVRDSLGNEFEASCGGVAYDANEWGLWDAAKQKEDLRQKNARIQHVESQVALLRSILVEQGVKVITTDQARELGIHKK